MEPHGAIYVESSNRDGKERRLLNPGGFRSHNDILGRLTVGSGQYDGIRLKGVGVEEAHLVCFRQHLTWHLKVSGDTVNLDGDREEPLEAEKWYPLLEDERLLRIGDGTYVIIYFAKKPHPRPLRQRLADSLRAI